MSDHTCPKGHPLEVKWNDNSQKTMLYCSECNDWWELDWKHTPFEEGGE